MDVMLDLETFGTSPAAAIIQIGAVTFDPAGAGIISRFCTNVTLQSAILSGAEVDNDTVGWWKAPEQAGARAALEEGPVVPIKQALFSFSQWWEMRGATAVWSHGAAFDIPILHSAYLAAGKVQPWAYRQIFDTRTVLRIAQQMGWQKPSVKTAHHALRDAEDQAIMIQQAMRVIFRP